MVAELLERSVVHCWTRLAIYTGREGGWMTKITQIKIWYHNISRTVMWASSASPKPVRSDFRDWGQNLWFFIRWPRRPCPCRGGRGDVSKCIYLMGVSVKNTNVRFNCEVRLFPSLEEGPGTLIRVINAGHRFFNDSVSQRIGFAILSIVVWLPPRFTERLERND